MANKIYKNTILQFMRCVCVNRQSHFFRHFMFIEHICFNFFLFSFGACNRCTANKNRCAIKWNLLTSLVGSNDYGVWVSNKVSQSICWLRRIVKQHFGHFQRKQKEKCTLQQKQPTKSLNMFRLVISFVPLINRSIVFVANIFSF